MEFGGGGGGRDTEIRGFFKRWLKENKRRDFGFFLLN
jgi:hypothetical protein